MMRVGLGSPECAVCLVQEEGKCGLWSVEVSWRGREFVFVFVLEPSDYLL